MGIGRQDIRFRCRQRQYQRRAITLQQVLAAMLAIYTSKGVAQEWNLRECISHTPQQSSNKAALKP